MAPMGHFEGLDVLTFGQSMHQDFTLQNNVENVCYRDMI